MNKTVIGVIVGVLAIVVIGAGVMIAGKDSSNSMDMSASDMPASEMAQAEQNSITNPAADQSTSEVQTGEVKMDIADFAFAQKTLKIQKGTTVTWTNQDMAKRDVAPDDESPNFVASELLAKGESYSYTFNEPGTYAYHCTPHPYMKATVEVVE